MADYFNHRLNFGRQLPNPPRSFCVKLYDRLPKELVFIRELILSSLWRSPERWGLAPE
jgi:hypothetical protein